MTEDKLKELVDQHSPNRKLTIDKWTDFCYELVSEDTIVHSFIANT